MQHILTALCFFQNCQIISFCGLELILSQKGYGIVSNLLSKAAEAKHDICQNVSVEFDRMHFSLCKSRRSDLQLILVTDGGWAGLAELLQEAHTEYSISHPNMETCWTQNCGLQLCPQHKKFWNLPSGMTPLCVRCHASLLPAILHLLVD